MKTPYSFPRHFLIILLCAAMALVTVEAATITSSNFSFGYGFTAPGPGSWNTTETSGTNTATTIGDFTFSPAVSGSAFGSNGPTFPNRVLTNGSSSYTGGSTTFDATITGTWSGTTPVDAAPMPNYQINIVITSISIFGAGLTGQATNDVGWSETTAGHASSSTTITLNQVSASSMRTASNYQQLSWNPNDFSVAGTSTSRSFALYSTGNEIRSMDGFQVFGYIELTYNAVPEPSTATLVVSGLALGAWMLRRRFVARKCS